LISIFFFKAISKFTNLYDKNKNKDINYKGDTDKNGMDASDKRSKNNKDFPPLHHLLHNEKENLDYEKIQHCTYAQKNSNNTNTNQYFENFT